MEKLVSSWFNNKTLPQSYIFPPETRPGNHVIPRCNTIPVVDLSKALAHERTAVVQQILEASQEFGFFQVINHGVSENLVNDTMNVFKEFFELPSEDKAGIYSEDLKRPCRLYTSSPNFNREKVHLWRDSLRLPCHPLKECIKIWPQKPTRYREIVAAYSIEAKKLGLRILELLSEGFGLGSGFFGDKLSESAVLSLNHYPPCPDPSLTLGVSKHCDPNLLTILLQGDVYGLQVLKDGEWIGVEPLHNAFVVNIGHQLEIISNNKLKSAEHRAVTNLKVARTTAAFFINPSDDCIIEPAKSLIGTDESPVYRAFEEVVATYQIEAKKLGLRILELLCEGIGIEHGPGNHIIPRSNAIPVIDLGNASAHDRTLVVQQILKASQEFGFFQVINHGVSEDLMNDTMNVFKEFFELPAEDKADLYSEEFNRPCKLYTSSANYDGDKVHLWRDSLRHPCHPLEECIKIWPQKPTRYRIGGLTYSTTGSIIKILKVALNGDVFGLQVLNDGKWIGVEPLHNAFVVNIGHQLEVVSNNRLKGAEHRVVTNSTVARTTAAIFLNPSEDCIVEPAKSLIRADESPAYRAFKFKEFLYNYVTMGGNSEKSLEPFKLHG
ncbi:hypothetical protein Gotri_013350 [Gossypium trilobum]|uniref:Fe2OG dioxygenase domain-containing protein n=1 Tax=Gossypium trilobum TaxID=34281 RepID=A0A7J9DT93_9ROSI|nr:hypothetical protein [Gossypium trilobum]